MRFFTTLSPLLLAVGAVAQNSSSSSCSPSSSDVQVVEYGYALSYFLDRFYNQVALNQTFLSGATNDSDAEYYPNFQGMQRLNRLAVRGVQQLGAKTSGFTAPNCSFTFPSANSGEAFVQTALTLESSVAGAYIALAGYTQAPEVSFLWARLAAEHTAHAYYLASNQEDILFPANSSGLVPAYSPAFVLSSGSQKGQLGRYLGGCVSAPPAPCGQTLFIGPIGATLTANVSASAAASSSASLAASATPSPSWAKRALF
ncbi:uncharacterized protein BP01DRAFT_111747 [Aspergillus saccharolyticus JOP 1030-1]|uniref:Ferritin-like domain-containing protein n=1 Tax=Aspergillus saccharolyticus JOP 1030-1 TaxID=1450539 RepID=A0A318ZXE2_9EURO|nr:hypothetical protein BP01DRAFT_111747 [Aspergillus saccharolyticus JOP 1030-1]PYH48760.1 hypothetical protein BP01DRAFT_111747 [Aspergillus saccharolyticus JOP 1030-1]